MSQINPTDLPSQNAQPYSKKPPFSWSWACVSAGAVLVVQLIYLVILR